MATIPLVPDSAPARLPAKWQWVAPFAAFGLLLAVGAGIGLVYQAQQDYRGVLSSAVLGLWGQGGAGPLSQAALLLTLWILWRIARKVSLYGAFFVVEWGLPGPRLDRQAFRFALAVQLATWLLYAVAGTFLLIFASFAAMPAPLITLGQAEAESLIGPLAPVAIALAALIAFDFTGYWLHRAQHRFAFLWRFHAVHHSVEDMDSLNSYAHPVDALSQNVALALVGLAIGFTFETILWLQAFQTIHDRLLHTRAPINFGILGAVLVDNRTHFLHHTRTEARSGRNFASTFTICDRLFGTYERPEADALCATGLEEQGPPATVRDAFLARLAGRQPAAETGEAAVSPGLPGAGCRPSA
ncbi:MAG TPA: sterol desaturase family protein [Allosphingosinicella sp.]|nr:sterol desaturase family protein [Allosphingosinicella sp.]